MDVDAVAKIINSNSFVKELKFKSIEISALQKKVTTVKNKLMTMVKKSEGQKADRFDSGPSVALLKRNWKDPIVKI